MRGGDLSKGLNSQFVDTFYELEIGYSLIEHGLDVDFNHRITGKTKTVKTPDIFLINEKTILEVKTLHQSEKINSGINSGNVFKIFEIERIAERIKHDLEKYSKLEINNPLIIILCNDYLINPTILSADDLEAFLLARADEVFVFGKEHVITGHREYSGFFYQDDGKIARGLSGVGLWSKKLIGFYENPNVKTQSKIPQGKFLEFLTNV